MSAISERLSRWGALAALVAVAGGRPRAAEFLSPEDLGAAREILERAGTAFSAGAAPRRPAPPPSALEAGPVSDGGPSLSAPGEPPLDWTRAQYGPAIPGWTSEEQRSMCGLVAAEALARFMAGKGDLELIETIRRLAQANGLWSPKLGMAGNPAEKKLLALLGVDRRFVAMRSPEEYRRAVLEGLRRGGPVILSTYRHYYVVQGIRPSGEFFVGNTGYYRRDASDRVRAGPWLELSEMAEHGGGLKSVFLPGP